MKLDVPGLVAFAGCFTYKERKDVALQQEWRHNAVENFRFSRDRVASFEFAMYCPERGIRGRGESGPQTFFPRFPAHFPPQAGPGSPTTDQSIDGFYASTCLGLSTGYSNENAEEIGAIEVSLSLRTLHIQLPFPCDFGSMLIN